MVSCRPDECTLNAHSLRSALFAVYSIYFSHKLSAKDHIYARCTMHNFPCCSGNKVLYSFTESTVAQIECIFGLLHKEKTK